MSCQSEHSITLFYLYDWARFWICTRLLPPIHGAPVLEVTTRISHILEQHLIHSLTFYYKTLVLSCLAPLQLRVSRIRATSMQVNIQDHNKLAVIDSRTTHPHFNYGWHPPRPQLNPRKWK